ncbi:hypothetical protein PO902_14225 [Planococcus maritimus]|nr:hypothetical protein [Planococcus sp. SK3692]MDE4086200.1 hypothetical protein [Planococcus maritimus]
MKVCKLCGNVDQLEFYLYQKTRCKSCVRKRQLEFNRANPEYLKAKNQRRRARKMSLENSLSTSEWRNVIETFGGSCCLSDSKNVVLEHVVPIGWGHGGTMVGNVVPMDATLNLAKRDKNLIEFIFDEVNAGLFSEAKIDFLIEYLAEANGLTVTDYIDFVYWCDDNKRTIDEATNDRRSSFDLFKEATREAMKEA